MSLDVAILEPASRQLRLVLKGQLDSATAATLEAALDGALRPDLQSLAFDLSALSFISSAGLRVFAKARRQMQAQGGRFFCVNPSPQVRKVFEIVKATPLNEIFASVQELDDYLQAMQQRLSDPP